jgi:hypothetical protein
MFKTSVRPLTNKRMDTIYRGLNHEGWFVEREGTACTSVSDTATGTYTLKARIHPETSSKTCLLRIERTDINTFLITCTTHTESIYSDPNVIWFMGEFQPFLERHASEAEICS